MRVPVFVPVLWSASDRRRQLGKAGGTSRQEEQAELGSEMTRSKILAAVALMTRSRSGGAIGGRVFRVDPLVVPDRTEMQRPRQRELRRSHVAEM